MGKGLGHRVLFNAMPLIRGRRAVRFGVSSTSRFQVQVFMTLPFLFVFLAPLFVVPFWVLEQYFYHRTARQRLNVECRAQSGVGDPGRDTDRTPAK